MNKGRVVRVNGGLMASFKVQLDQDSCDLESLGQMFSFSGAV